MQERERVSCVRWQFIFSSPTTYNCLPIDKSVEITEEQNFESFLHFFLFLLFFGCKKQFKSVKEEREKKCKMHFTFDMIVSQSVVTICSDYNLKNWWQIESLC